MPVGSPGASGVVGVARVGGLGVHGGAGWDQEADGLSVLRLESDPGGARRGNINLEKEGNLYSGCETRSGQRAHVRLSERGGEKKKEPRCENEMRCVSHLFRSISMC